MCMLSNLMGDSGFAPNMHCRFMALIIIAARDFQTDVKLGKKVCMPRLSRDKVTCTCLNDMNACEYMYVLV